MKIKPYWMDHTIFSIPNMRFIQLWTALRTQSLLKETKDDGFGYPFWGLYSSIFLPSKSCKPPNRTGQILAMFGLRLQTHPKNEPLYIGDLLDKSKNAGHCEFPLANLHSVESV